MTGLILFVIGVSGCGKSTVGQAVAKGLGATFLEGDAYHPPKNIAAMSAGQPLNDDMRWGWLRSLASAARNHAENGEDVVAACSGLKHSYRDLLRSTSGPCKMIFLDGEKQMIFQRLNARTGHYMPPSLLDSQFSNLQRPTGSETDVETVKINGTLEHVIDVSVGIALSYKEGLAQRQAKS